MHGKTKGRDVLLSVKLSRRNINIPAFLNTDVDLINASSLIVPKVNQSNVSSRHIKMCQKSHMHLFRLFSLFLYADLCKDNFFLFARARHVSVYKFHISEPRFPLSFLPHMYTLTKTGEESIFILAVLF